MDGVGTNERLLTELIMGRPGYEIRWLKTAYAMKNKKDLAERVDAELSKLGIRFGSKSDIQKGEFKLLLGSFGFHYLLFVYFQCSRWRLIPRKRSTRRMLIMLKWIRTWMLYIKLERKKTRYVVVPLTLLTFQV